MCCFLQVRSLRTLLCLRSITITIIILPLALSAATQPLLLRGPVKSVELNHPIASLTLRPGKRKGGQPSSSNMLGFLLPFFNLMGLVKGVSPGPSHCGGFGFTQVFTLALWLLWALKFFHQSCGVFTRQDYLEWV